MKRQVIHQLALLCIATCVFLFAASFAYAETIPLPQQDTFSAFTLSKPLAFIHPLTFSELTTSISLTENNKLLVSQADSKKPLEAIGLTPTIAVTEASSTGTMKQPTPTSKPHTQKTEIFEKTQTTTPTIPPKATTPPSTKTITSTQQSDTGGLNADDLFAMVNAYRASHSLPAFQQDAKTCSLAQERAPAVAGEVTSGHMHAGLAAMHLPYWDTENIIEMRSDQEAFTWWINDTIHREAILGNFKYSCMACSGDSCAEEFTNYQPK